MDIVILNDEDSQLITIYICLSAFFVFVFLFPSQ